VAKRGSRSKVDTTAESIGSAFGRVAARLDHLKKQRSEIAAELNRVVAAAQRMLNHLGPEGDAPAQATAVKAKRTLSAAARARISAAQKKRWAEVKKAAKK
jgi:ElaB/YqjD/DUF883 family membrane-anchored ribosome-binding protein